ncbi:MAG: hybrid sensor histidine kinase/response regulator [Thermomonas sp.]|uniref:ATP-binding response regulator n=1 Tax=Thermomonas sp. TaxID=1971895 RepID=UPI0039E4D988
MSLREKHSIHRDTPPLSRMPLLREWALRVLLPLLLAVSIAFGLLLFAATRLHPQGIAGMSGTLWQAGLLLVAALALTAALGWRIAMRLVRPISELTAAVECLGRGEQVHLDVLPGEVLGRLQRGVNEASQALADAHNRMHSELGRTSIELADKNAKLEAASQSRARFLAAASHDLRQPLYALTLFSSALRTGETDPDKLARVLRIEECVTSLDQLFSELLDLSRLEAGAMQAVHADVALDDVFDEVSRNFRMLAESRGLRLIVRKTDAWVRCDRTMLARILNNLVSNALRYTDDGGVLVGVRHQHDGKVRVDVWDTGCGIAPEHQERVFEAFYRVNGDGDTGKSSSERGRGLGLGLATVRKLAELAGCRIDLASRPQRGTRVSVLVEAGVPAAHSSNDAFDLPLDISGLRVLVIDDEISILEGLRALLEEWGCDIRAAENEAEALQQVAHWPTPPDLVISDLRLREGRSGMDALRALARHYGQDPQQPGFARLLVTGETRPDRIGEIAASRIPVLFKPVSPQRLREAMLASVFAASVMREGQTQEQTSARIRSNA